MWFGGIPWCDGVVDWWSTHALSSGVARGCGIVAGPVPCTQTGLWRTVASSRKTHPLVFHPKTKTLPIEQLHFAWVLENTIWIALQNYRNGPHWILVTAVVISSLSITIITCLKIHVQHNLFSITCSADACFIVVRDDEYRVEGKNDCLLCRSCRSWTFNAKIQFNSNYTNHAHCSSHRQRTAR